MLKAFSAGTFNGMRALPTPALLATLLIGLSLSGCSQNQPAKTDDKTDGKAAPAGKPKVTKLLIEDIKVGTGNPVAAGDNCSVRYTGSLGDGSVFDTNNVPGKPVFTFVAGPTGNVIKGWQEGVIGMKVGGERKLSIPSEMGYGPNAQGEKIPANSDLYFTIKLEGVMKQGEESTVRIKDVKPGAGRVVKDGDTLTIQFRGTLPDGTEIDKGKYDFKVGTRPPEVIPGIDRGVVGMKMGGTRELKIPPMAAFGPLGKEPVVPANVIVTYVVTVLAIK